MRKSLILLLLLIITFCLGVIIQAKNNITILLRRKWLANDRILVTFSIKNNNQTKYLLSHIDKVIYYPKLEGDRLIINYSFPEVYLMENNIIMSYTSSNIHPKFIKILPGRPYTELIEIDSSEIKPGSYALIIKCSLSSNIVNRGEIMMQDLQPITNLTLYCGKIILR